MKRTRQGEQPNQTLRPPQTIPPSARRRWGLATPWRRLAPLLICCITHGGIATIADASDLPQVLGLPPSDGPLVVSASFTLLDVNEINEINEEAETFEFTGVLSLQWKDERQAFDPQVEGVQAMVFQGEFQFNELAPAWFPQVILKNASGMYEKSAVLLRVDPDGVCTLIESVNAVAESKLDLRRSPYDVQTLEAVFEVFGYDEDQVHLKAAESPAEASVDEIRIPQWSVAEVRHLSREIPSSYQTGGARSVAYVLSISAPRRSFFLFRLVVMPLALIVVLSWSIFWMEQSSLGDRMSVSFVGILTAVSYQIFVGDITPRISYFTFLNGFINFSFWLMCATVPVNLVVGALHKKGREERAVRIDRICRRLFPLGYLLLIVVLVLSAFTWN